MFSNLVVSVASLRFAINLKERFHPPPLPLLPFPLAPLNVFDFASFALANLVPATSRRSHTSYHNTLLLQCSDCIHLSYVPSTSGFLHSSSCWATPMTDAYVFQVAELPFWIMAKPSSCRQGIAWHWPTSLWPLGTKTFCAFPRPWTSWVSKQAPLTLLCALRWATACLTPVSSESVHLKLQQAHLHFDELLIPVKVAVET